MLAYLRIFEAVEVGSRGEKERGGVVVRGNSPSKIIISSNRVWSMRKAADVTRHPLREV